MPYDPECLTCTEGGYPEGECPESKRPCGHHCNCSWIHDHCHWCDAEFGGDGEVTYPPAAPLRPLSTSTGEPEAMRISDLIDSLVDARRTHGNVQVVLAKDAEGNGYSPLDQIEPGGYLPSTTWSGERDASGDPAVFLWPVN